MSRDSSAPAALLFESHSEIVSAVLQGSVLFYANLPDGNWSGSLDQHQVC